MIRLYKGPTPPSLAANADAWTRELDGLISTGETVPSRLWREYQKRDVKEQAIRDSWSKCIYCESRLLHVSFGELEHMKPKSRFHRLTFEWANIGLVCSRCNNAKRDRYDEETPPIDPFGENPEEFIFAWGPWIWSRPGSDRGRETIELVDLNRPELIEQRQARAESVRHLAETLSRTTGVAAREALQEELQIQLGDDKEFALVSRGVIRTLEVRSA